MLNHGERHFEPFRRFEWVAYWPDNADELFGDVTNSTKKYVVSNSLQTADGTTYGQACRIGVARDLNRSVEPAQPPGRAR